LILLAFRVYIQLVYSRERGKMRMWEHINGIFLDNI